MQIDGGKGMSGNRSAARWHFLFLMFVILSMLHLSSTWRSARGAEKFYSIQIAATKDLDTAMKTVDEMAKLGHNAFYREEEIKGKGRWYRVYVERYTSKGEAEKEAKALKGLGLISDYSIKALEGSEKTPQPAAPVSPVTSATPAAPKKESSGLIHYLHIGSFKEKGNAEGIVQNLVTHGYKAFFVEEDTSGEKWFRVYIGEFSDEKEARKAGVQLKEKGLITYFKTLTFDKGIPSLQTQKGKTAR